jgi:DNA-binding transcriptional LysR family regulator
MADRRLHVFYSVARLLSFTKAAEALHMTQPAVTFQIRQLEDYFNTRLFDRTHNRISLTPAGQIVQEYSGRIFQLYNEMETTVREMTGEINGVLMLGASTTVAEYMLPSLLGDFRRQYPDIELRLKVSNTEGVVSMVENNIIDLGVVEAPVLHKHLAIELCRSDRLVAIVPPGHPLAQKSRVEVAELLAYPFISREEGSSTRDIIQEYLRQAGVDYGDLTTVMELGSQEALKGAVEAGIGISIVSRLTLQKELKLGTLAMIELDPPLERAVSIVHQNHKFRQAAVKELINFARHYCATHPNTDC